jgi:hypothetical protein
MTSGEKEFPMLIRKLNELQVFRAKVILFCLTMVFMMIGVGITADIRTWNLATSTAGWGPRFMHSSVVFDNKIWILGGHSGTDAKAKNDVWYSSNGVDWTQATSSASWSARDGHTTVVFNNKMWTIGGNTCDGPSYEGGIGYKNDVWYSIDGINWIQATSSAPWPARYTHTSVVFHDKLWVMGGQVSPAYSKINDVWYSSDGVNWTQATDSAPWVARCSLISVVFNDKIWVIGGNGPDRWDAPNQKDVWYSSDGKNWVQATSSAPFGDRAEHESVVFDNKIWIMGGSSANFAQDSKNDVWNSSDGVNWTQVISSTSWPPRLYHTSVVFNGKIYIIGGRGNFEGDWGKGVFSDVWWYGSSFSGCSDIAVKPYAFTASTPAKASEVNANFDTIYKNDINLNCQIQALKAIVCQDHPTASICQ